MEKKNPSVSESSDRSAKISSSDTRSKSSVAEFNCRVIKITQEYQQQSEPHHRDKTKLIPTDDKWSSGRCKKSQKSKWMIFIFNNIVSCGSCFFTNDKQKHGVFTLRAFQEKICWKIRIDFIRRWHGVVLVFCTQWLMNVWLHCYLLLFWWYLVFAPCSMHINELLLFTNIRVVVVWSCWGHSHETTAWSLIHTDHPHHPTLSD